MALNSNAELYITALQMALSIAERVRSRNLAMEHNDVAAGAAEVSREIQKLIDALDKGPQSLKE